MILNVFNKNQKSDFEIYMYEAEMNLKKAMELEELEKYQESKLFYEKASSIYLQASKISPNAYLKHEAYLQYKQCKLYFYNIHVKITKANIIVNKERGNNN